MLKDCCAIAPNSVVPPETIVSPLAYFSGMPGKFIFKSKKRTDENVTLGL